MPSRESVAHLRAAGPRWAVTNCGARFAIEHGVTNAQPIGAILTTTPSR